MNLPILWYFADPMCSWCWGFSPVIRQIRQHFDGQMNVALVVGGLRPGETSAMTPEQREEILHHWHEVEQRTGQRFGFEHALPEGFVYDTEPACRAVVTFGALNSEDRMAYLQAIQSAFYVENQNVTDKHTLARLASQFGLEKNRFVEQFDSGEMIARTRLHFEQARKAGVKGFPTLILQRDQDLEKLGSGYCDIEDLKERLLSLLES